MADDEEQKALKDQRIPILMTETEVAAIDDWMFAHRIKSRGEAIRRLCTIGLMWDQYRDDLTNNALETMRGFTKVLEAVPNDLPAKGVDPQWVLDLVDLHVAFDALAGEIMSIDMPSYPLRTNPNYRNAVQEAAKQRIKAMEAREEIQRDAAEISNARGRGKK